jgi:hypothetical protein
MGCMETDDSWEGRLGVGKSDIGEIEEEVCCTWDSEGSVRHGLGRFDGSFD